MKNVTLLSILMVLFTLPSGIFAQEPRILDKQARSMGMGGVGVSSFGYSFSPMANPAALGLMSDYTMVPMFDLGFVLNNETVSFIKDIQSIVAGASLTNINYDQYVGKSVPVGVSGPLSLGFMGKGFGIWMNMGAEAQIGIFHPENSSLKGIQVNTLFNTIEKVSNVVINSGGSLTASSSEISNILQNGIYKDLINSGLSPEQIYAQANDLLNQVAGTTGNVYIDTTGNLDMAQIDTALVAGGDLKINQDALKQIIPRLTARFYADIAVNIGYGYKIPFRALDNVSGLSFGATLRFIQRFKSDTITNKGVDELSSGGIIENSLWQAFSISSDFGLSLRIQNFVLGFAVRDAFSAPFQWRGLLSGAAHPASSFAPSLDIGASYRFLFSNPWIQEVGIYFEAVDMLNTVTTAAQKIRVGLETRLFRFLDLRLGMYDTFVTAGVGMGGKWGRVDFAYYRETYSLYKNYSVYGDRFSLNLSLSLENTPARKAAASTRKAAKEAAAAVNVTEALETLPPLETLPAN